MAFESRIVIESEHDIVQARQQGRLLSSQIGLNATQQTLVATAISEVARNIVVHAGKGEILLSTLEERGRKGIRVIATDQGPGIQSLAQAMRDGYSTTHSLGMGLPGSKRLMDDFELASEIGKGTTVTMTKWCM